MSALSARVLNDVEELEQLAPAWGGLLAASDRDEVFNSPDWMLTWWEVFGRHDGRRLCCVRFDQGGQLVGLAPLLRRRHWYKPGLPFRRLELLASGEREADAICSDHLTILAGRDQEQAVVSRLIEMLKGGRLGGWDEVVIPLMDGSGRMPELLVTTGRAAGLIAEQETTTEAPYIPLPGSWDGYLGMLSSSNRYFVRKTLRDFESWAGKEIEVQVAGTPGELAEGWRILVELHRERWQDTGKGVFRSPLFLEFHRRMTERLLARGGLELLWLKVRSKPVAAIYNILWGGKTAFYQCGRVSDLPPRIRIGIVIHAYAIRRAIEAGRREYDFLGGEAQYKRQLAPVSRPLLQVRLARPGMMEAVRRLVERGKQFVRPIRSRWCRGNRVRQEHEGDGNSAVG